MSADTSVERRYGLDHRGITNVDTVHWDLPTPLLYEQALRRHEARLAHLGPLVVGKPSSADQRWWARFGERLVLITRAQEPSSRRSCLRSRALISTSASTNLSKKYFASTCRRASRSTPRTLPEELHRYILISKLIGAGFPGRRASRR